MPYANPERRKEYLASYRMQHRERLAEYKKEQAKSVEVKEGRRATRRAFYAANKDRICAQERQYWAAKTEPHRDRRLQRRYGITIDEFNAMVKSQDGKCALCEEPLKLGTKSVHVDHCHETGKVRGVLCARCNLGIGRFGDNIRGLERAIEYLKRSLD